MTVRAHSFSFKMHQYITQDWNMLSVSKWCCNWKRSRNLDWKLGLPERKKKVAKLAMGTLCTIQASSASESTQAEPLGRHERKFCAEKAAAPFLSERPRLSTVKIGSKSTYSLIITVGF